MIEVVGLMHHAIPIGKGDADALAKAREFYGDWLGLPLDTGRPDIPGTPGYWYNVPSGLRSPASGKKDTREVGPPPAHLRQIHLIGRPIQAQADQTDSHDVMTRKVAHLALAVTNLSAAKDALDQRGISYSVQTAAVGAEQVFFFDPFGNQIELQEAR
ncbi:MAG: hypothetical protein CL878_07460 [Dehalococcoidia bacterium]|nr:hypothetical protein [Dehalococcoidia bacterium]